MRRALARSALVLGSLLVPLAMLELTVRLLGPVVPGYYETGLWYTYHPIFGTFHAPGSTAWVRTREYTTFLRFNHEGFRGPERDPGPPGTQLILLLGDSFIEAKEAAEDQTITAVLQRVTMSATGQPLRWASAGVSGWSPLNQYLYLREEGANLAPRTVVLCLYLGNDVVDSIPPSRALQSRLHKPSALVDDAGNLVLLPWSIPTLNPDEALLLALSPHLRLARMAQTGIIDKIRYAPPPDTVWVEPRLLDTLANKESPAITEAYRVIDAELGAILDETERLGANLLLVLIPTKWQVYRELWDAELARRGLADDGFSLQRPNRRLAGLAAQRGIPVLDLLPALRQLAADGTRVYFEIDPHWTIAGQAKAAEQIVDFLERGDLLTPSQRSAEAGPASGL